MIYKLKENEYEKVRPIFKERDKRQRGKRAKGLIAILPSSLLAPLPSSSSEKATFIGVSQMSVGSTLT